jgi:hypothetical protein
VGTSFDDKENYPMTKKTQVKQNLYQEIKWKWEPRKWLELAARLPLGCPLLNASLFTLKFFIV